MGGGCSGGPLFGNSDGNDFESGNQNAKNYNQDGTVKINLIGGFEEIISRRRKNEPNSKSFTLIKRSRESNL